MKLAPIPDYNPLIGEPHERWSLSWQPDGRCDEFTRQAILACAPADSGVYGLFNFDCQIFIGESANIREVLLRLETETDFQSPHLRPTGFTFELCPEDSRKEKAAELIAQYRPALQTTGASNDFKIPVNQSMEIPAEELRSASESAAENHEFPVHVEIAPQGHRISQSKRTQSAVVLAILLIAGGAGFYFFKQADTVRDRQSGAVEQPSRVSQPPVSDSIQAQVSAKPGAVPVEKPAAAKSHDEEILQKANGAVRLAKSSGMEDSALQKLTAPAPTSRTNILPEKNWSVQISAAPARDVADRMAQDLIAKGYDSYVAHVEVKGHTYYRVRAGRFAGREDAESLRQSLLQQERYRDAYVTSD